MSKVSKPYIKCEKIGGFYVLTAMKSVGRGHALAGRGKVPMGDPLALQAEVIRMVDEARVGDPRWEIQADGRSQ